MCNLKNYSLQLTRLNNKSFYSRTSDVSGTTIDTANETISTSVTGWLC